MGIAVEFNPDLALRNISFFKKGERKLEECIPENLEKGQTCSFLKKGQRNYWLLGEVPLVETDGSRLSRPLAGVKILSVTHFLKDGEMWTKGEYEIVEVFSLKKTTVYFEGFARR